MSSILELRAQMKVMAAEIEKMEAAEIEKMESEDTFYDTVTGPPTLRKHPEVSLVERQEAPIDHTKCLCRIWKKGLDNVQCSRNKKEGDFCMAHIKRRASAGEWWLGLVTGLRVEEPFGPPTSTKPGHHYWYDQLRPPKTMNVKGIRYPI